MTAAAEAARASREGAFAAAAEYAALHLCGGKHRAKAFEPPDDDDDDDDEDGFGASIESSSGSSDDDGGDGDADGDDDGDDDDDAKTEEDAGVPPAKRSKSEGAAPELGWSDGFGVSRRFGHRPPRARSRRRRRRRRIAARGDDRGVRRARGVRPVVGRRGGVG